MIDQRQQYRCILKTGTRLSISVSCCMQGDALQLNGFCKICPSVLPITLHNTNRQGQNCGAGINCLSLFRFFVTLLTFFGLQTTHAVLCSASSPVGLSNYPYPVVDRYTGTCESPPNCHHRPRDPIGLSTSPPCTRPSTTQDPEAPIRVTGAPEFQGQHIQLVFYELNEESKSPYSVSPKTILLLDLITINCTPPVDPHKLPHGSVFRVFPISIATT